MTLFTTNELIASIFAIVCGSALTTFGFYLEDKTKPLISTIITIIGLGSAVFASIFLIYFGVGTFTQQNYEPVYYQEQVELRNSLQTAINNSTNLVNTALHTRAAEFNAELSSLQYAQSISTYSWSFSGKVDWNTIPHIKF